MADLRDPKDALLHYLQRAREALLWKLDGLGERDLRLPRTPYDADPQADWWVPASVPAAQVVDFYRSVWTFSDATIADLPLDAAGSVAWWPPKRRAVTLHRILVHVLADTTRHAGHADVLREGIDGAAGLTSGVTNLPDVDWPAYVARRRRIAEEFPV